MTRLRQSADNYPNPTANWSDPLGPTTSGPQGLGKRWVKEAPQATDVMFTEAKSKQADSTTSNTFNENSTDKNNKNKKGILKLYGVKQIEN